MKRCCVSSLLVLASASLLTGMGHQMRRIQPEKPDAGEPVSTEPVSDQGEDTASAKELREVILMLDGGREVTGILADETDDAFVLRIESIDTTFRKVDVRHVRYLEPLLDRYAKMRSLVAADDLDGRVLLAEWLRSREQYALALTEVEYVLRKDGLHPQAKRLQAWLEQQIALEGQRVRPDEGDRSDQSGKDRFAEREAAKEKFPLLNQQDINAIRVYEVDLKYPPRMNINRSTIDRLIRENAENPLIPATMEGRESMYRLPAEDILRLMFSLQARDLYKEVQIFEHPRAIRLFRSEVHGRWLINSCASAQCHGGQEAGRLWLYTESPNADRTVYTNLLILDRFKLSDGTPLINYSQPAKSPLLQMALPQDLALYPHPDAPRTRGSRGWKPVFRSTQDRRFQQALEWISSMYRPRPEYPIDYTAPTPRPRSEDPEPDR